MSRDVYLHTDGTITVAVSDTPKSDKAAVRCACSSYVVPSEFARELERELMEQALLLGKSAERELSLRAKHDQLLQKMQQLERENAALREALVKAMDALKSGCEHERFAAWARASRVLDAARGKEEQP